MNDKYSQFQKFWIAFDEVNIKIGLLLAIPMLLYWIFVIINDNQECKVTLK